MYFSKFSSFQKSTKTSFRSVISDVAAAISMTKLPSDAVDEADEELQVIVEHEAEVQNLSNR